MGAERSDPRRVTRTTLENGLEVARQAPPVDAASFAATIVVPAGWAYDPASAGGTALATSRLLTSGAGRWSRIDLDRLLDRWGATLVARCDPESAEVTAWGPARRWRELLEILVTASFHPRLSGADLRRVQRQIAERQMRERSQPASRAAVELGRTIFPVGHPYRLTGVGTARSITDLTSAGVHRFHRDHFRLDGSLLAATGTVGLDELGREVRRRLRNVPNGAPPPDPPVPVGPDRRGGHRHVAMPGKTQVEIRLGGSSIARAVPEYEAASLANEVLGGRPMISRLFQRLRDAEGLAYHASSDLQAMRWGGLFVAGAGAGPERAAQAAASLREEVERVATTLTPSIELERTRRSAIGELPLALETTSGAHELAVEIAYHHLPDDYLVRWPETVRRLTAKDVLRGAEVAMRPDRLTLITVGPDEPAPAGTPGRR